MTLLNVDVTPVFAAAIPVPNVFVDHEVLEREMREKLQAVIPADAKERSIETVIECVEDFDAAAAIVKAAERHGSDVICLGTRGQSGWSALLGSTAREVVRRSPRPVLVVPSGSE
jgi:nucleotide-binding universal stress UspA family protein